MEKISKAQVKLVRSLQQKKYRDESGLFVAEGAKCVDELRKSFELVHLYREGENATRTEIEQMSGLRTPQGVVGVFKKRPIEDCRLKIEDLHLNGALPISTEKTKALVHKMRAENMAIMVGTRTVLLDNPRLLNTHWEGRNPIRVTLDRHNVIPADARIFSDESETIVYRERTDWPFILSDLAKRNIHSILVEGGTTLLNHILETGIWDEIHVEVAPELRIGEGVAAPQICLPDTCEIVDGHQLYTIKK